MTYRTNGAPDAARLAALFENLPLGVVLLDAAGRVVCVNRYEREMARRHAEGAVGRDFFAEVAPCLDLRALGGAFRQGVAAGRVRIESEVSFRFEHMPAPREVKITIHSFEVGESLFAAVCFQDIGAFREHERRRDLLAATAVHDVRTPLTTATLELEAALRGMGETPARALVESARESVAQAARLTSTALEVLRIARGEVAEASVEVDLVPLAEAALRTLRPLASAQGVRLGRRGDPSAPFRGEADLVRRALENLLDNALRASPEGKAVELWVARTPSGARISVVDRGPGVAPERRAEIFELGRTSGELPSNFGLGLALVAMVAGRHRGSARVEETPGGGATFVLELESDPAPA